MVAAAAAVPNTPSRSAGHPPETRRGTCPSRPRPLHRWARAPGPLLRGTRATRARWAPTVMHARIPLPPPPGGAKVDAQQCRGNLNTTHAGRQRPVPGNAADPPPSTWPGAQQCHRPPHHRMAPRNSHEPPRKQAPKTARGPAPPQTMHPGVGNNGCWPRPHHPDAAGAPHGCCRCWQCTHPPPSLRLLPPTPPQPARPRHMPPQTMPWRSTPERGIGTTLARRR